MRGSLPRLVLQLALTAPALALGGCTAVGYVVGSDIADARRGTSVAIEQAAEIEHGTPVQVGLQDGGSVRGVCLGTFALDSAGVAGPRQALRLGVGNPSVVDRLFEKGLALTEPTREQVPDTLVFPLDGVRGLRIPVSSQAGKAGAAAGLATDIAVTSIVVTALAVAGIGAAVAFMVGALSGH